MKFTNYIFAVLTILLMSSEAFSHDAKLHKGKPLEGKVFYIGSGTFKVESDAGQTEVRVNDDTVFETGHEGSKASLKDLKNGAQVMVFGTKLEPTILVAKEVMIHTDTPEAPHKH